jgi:predicted outer membrane repeat protein
VSQRWLAGVAAALVPLPSPAAEHSVRPDGLGDFPTIQAAVDAAAALDTIWLEDGVFQGNGNRDVEFHGKDLVVRSRNGPLACTIDSQGTQAQPHRAFRLDEGETPASRIEGITLTGGFVEGPFPESGGGGILVAYGSHPVIADCVFDGNEAGFQGFGAGLLAWEDCDITLTDCVFVNGVSGWYGGGFVLRKYCDALVERCIVDGNYALHGGGGGSITNSNAVVVDCSFTNNSVTEAGAGGCLVKASAEPVFRRCVFAGNSAWAGGGIGMGNLPKVTAIDCLFEGNYAFGASGGAIHADYDGSEITLENCTFVNNRAEGPAQHLLVSFTGAATVRRSIFDAGCDGSLVAQVDAGGSLDVECSIVAGGAGALAGAGTITWGPGNLDADPMFCAPAGCGAPSYPSGDYTLDSHSPAAPSWNACGLVGAYPVACGATSVAEGLTERSWGGIKSLFRSR